VQGCSGVSLCLTNHAETRRGCPPNIVIDAAETIANFTQALWACAARFEIPFDECLVFPESIRGTNFCSIRVISALCVNRWMEREGAARAISWMWWRPKCQSVVSVRVSHGAARTRVRADIGLWGSKNGWRIFLPNWWAVRQRRLSFDFGGKE